jgi:O-methyltransferase
MPINLAEYFRTEAEPVRRYAGQLAPDFQAALADHFSDVTEAACVFSHTIELPGGQIQKGVWDLRGSEAAVLGRFAFAGKRVLEYGPSSGWLTTYLASQDAKVVALEMATGNEQHLAPSVGPLPASAVMEIRQRMDRLRRSWWFVRRQADFKAAIVYADLQEPPSDLGRFDVCTFFSTLLRLPNPYLALQHAAEMTDGAIIVTEPLMKPIRPGDQEVPLATFAPSLPPNEPNHWWQFSPAAICRMLMTVGFLDLNVAVHTPERGTRLPMFTVTARRKGAVVAAAAE